MNLFKSLLILLSMLFIISCSAPEVSHYSGSQPNFDFKTFFNGKLKAYGVVQDYKGELTRKLVVNMDARWEGNIGIIEEDFVYDDGETQKRIWNITLNEDGTAVGQADDVIGDAIGRSQGSVFHWKYRVVLPYKGDTLETDFDDWMYLVTPDKLINRTSINKFGIEVGQVTLVIEK
ncbi:MULTISPECIES: DUF3833 domain-containing protein [Vibrio]|uniref:DUF3833 domain-containing protein n=1 Tax=Vibrio casei TaxID=673372 RepID=A0A368LH85_9VIBR|nr:MULTISPECIES: DUF3833 domain-containing protein [Vibrio]RCS70104.1 DUF3833 domain-containing protein [Vibrio casei]SJN24002.1 Putative lipoprotein precursor [Vibrio casei]HBV76049.1 DUF3833 domain-containing protein [Vibrio sp.]